MMRVILRKDAKARGLKRYFTGKPCKHGHVAERRVSDGKCVDCCSLQLAAWRAKNKGRKATMNAAWYAKNKERKATTAAAWRADNKERVIATQAAYRADNKERRAAKIAAWFAANPDKMAEYKHRRRARKANALGSHTVVEIKELLVQQGYRCANPRCGADLRVVKKHLDHKNPLSRPETNPTNSIDNLQWLCQPCNDSKGNKTHEEFAQYRKQMKCETV